MSVIFNSLNESEDLKKENILEGYYAVEAAIMTLFDTPLNKIPEYPSLGFDLDDFLHRSEASEAWSSLETEVADKVSIVCNTGTPVTCRITRDKEFVDIDITYVYENGEARVTNLEINVFSKNMRLKSIQVP